MTSMSLPLRASELSFTWRSLVVTNLLPLVWAIETPTIELSGKSSKGNQKDEDTKRKNEQRNPRLQSLNQGSKVKVPRFGKTGDDELGLSGCGLSFFVCVRHVQLRACSCRAVDAEVVFAFFTGACFVHYAADFGFFCRRSHYRFPLDS